MQDPKADPVYGVPLTWEVNPFRVQPAKGAAVLLIALLFVAVATVFAGPVLGVISLFILAGSVGPFFVTTRYRLTQDVVVVRSIFQKVTRPWGDFRKMHKGVTGVSLSPFRGRHLLDPYRSVMLRYGAHRTEILEWVSRFGPGSEDQS